MRSAETVWSGVDRVYLAEADEMKSGTMNTAMAYVKQNLNYRASFEPSNIKYGTLITVLYSSTYLMIASQQRYMPGILEL